MLPVEPAFNLYTNLNGNPLDDGYVYYGLPNQNPITSPVVVYWDAAGTQPAAQPLRTVNGYIVRAGTPANVFFNGEYSQIVQDSAQRLVYFAPNSSDFSIVGYVNSFIANLANTSDADKGAALIGRGVQVIDSIAALKQLLITSASDYAYITGYFSAYDGGAGWYRLDASDVVSADNGCTVIVAVDGGRWKLVHDGVIHIAQWGNNLSNAIDNMPVGGHLLLGAGPYVAKFNKTRSDLKVTGIGMPTYNGGNTALSGGTVIQGTFGFTGDRLEFSSFGIDCGSTVCTAINGGTAMDGLVITDATRTIRNQIVVRDVKCLLKDPTSAFHNFLLEGLNDSRFENLISRNGQWGTVMKTTASTADGIISYNCSQAGFTFKSDTGVAGTPALRSSVSNVLIDNSGYAAAAQGILLYAATSSLAYFTLNNYQTRGGDIGVTLLCDTRAVNVNLLFDVALSNGAIQDAVTMGFKTFGAISKVLVNNLDITGTVSNKSIEVGSDCLGIEFTNVNCSAPVVNALNVNLAGRFSFDNLRSFVLGDYNSPSGINMVPESSATFTVGNYIGTVGFSGVQTWTPAWTGLTVVNGTGGVTHTGSYKVIGKRIKGQAQIAVTGTATTASTAATTFINNLPWQPVRNDACLAISGTVTNGGVGFVQSGGQNCFTPTWAAYNGTMVISFDYPFQN
jgi:hypothetical protein